ncbi:MAG: DUF1800 domain-containing protein [Chitinophagaceae bacterium]|nr:MAG: DUF1800 domain-containing protein [Chitinophagaceae bacterium]
MLVSGLKKNQHLLWRAGFGPDTADREWLSLSTRDLLTKMLADSGAAPAYINVADAALKAASVSPQSNNRKLAQLSRQNIKELNLTWLDQMVTSRQQLREKLSLFWHGHFAATSGNIFFQQQLLDVIRTNALGKFGTLLREVSKSATMINYLNNNRNRKNSPNENFARELMELFTLGRGKYSENDVKEAARAFTGWAANPSGDFIFRSNQHDENQKSFLGRTGNFTGDDILDIILAQKHTAHHVTSKIYRYFVNERINDSHVEWLAKRFYSSDYDITGLMADIFRSDWFYEPGNIGNRIKSPVELIVGIRRTFIPRIQNESVQLLIQRLLGQLLFYPPNVAGWPGGYNWIDSSSLMLRLQIPKWIISSENIQLKPKGNDDQAMGMIESETRNRYNSKSPQRIQADLNWEPLFSLFANTKRGQLPAEIINFLVVPQISKNAQIIVSTEQANNRENYIKSAIISIMCLPEYQLC